MGKIVLIAVVVFLGYAFREGWLGDWVGGRPSNAAACAKARTTVQETETRITTGGAMLDGGGKQRLSEARDFIAQNCR